MGAYQPHYKWAGNTSPPRGQVYGYRMSLWAEHLSSVEECFRRPETEECVGALPGHECFPDVGGKVLGTQSSLPNALKT
nr:unnamed protein product [Digitaria exilis]